jgi:predicted transcriptional regulator
MKDKIIVKINDKDFKNRRMSLNISQSDFANVAGVSYRTILRFEQGKTVSVTSMDKIVRTLGGLESSPANKNDNLWWKSHKNALLKEPEA